VGLGPWLRGGWPISLGGWSWCCRWVGGSRRGSGVYPRARRSRAGRPSISCSSESSNDRVIGRLWTRKPSAISARSRRASTGSLTRGSPLRLPLVATRGRPKRTATSWCRAEAGSITPRLALPGARASRARAKGKARASPTRPRTGSAPKGSGPIDRRRSSTIGAAGWCNWSRSAAEIQQLGGSRPGRPRAGPGACWAGACAGAGARWPRRYSHPPATGSRPPPARPGSRRLPAGRRPARSGVGARRWRR
jgi:hypothetical protein